MKDSVGTTFRVFAWMALGATVILSLPAVVGPFTGDGTPLLWWSARALGLLAYVALWLSMIFGVFVAGRGAGGLLHQSTLIQLHQRWALVGLGATALHVLVIIADPHAGVSPLAALVPMTSAELTGAVAIGTLSLWGLLAIALTTHFLDRLPAWVWRAVHASAFGSFVLALVHAVTAGSSSGSFTVRAFYGATTAALLAAIIQRVLLGQKTRAQSKGERT